MDVQIIGRAHPAYINAEELTKEEERQIRAERRMKRIAFMMREATGRNALVDQNGLEVLPSAQSNQCRTCALRETKACCEAGCELFRDLIFGWQCGLSPVENRFIPEEEREDRLDLIINPCQYCKNASRHLDLRIMQMVLPSCSGTRSKKFREITKDIE